MAITRKGPFDLRWGDKILADVESIETDVEQDSEDYTTVQGQTYTVDGAIKASVVLTLLKTNIEALAAVLPQYYVPNGGVMSTGETVNNAAGAIDVKAASCDTTPVYNNLDITSCGTHDVWRLVNARTKVEGLEFDDKRGTVSVRFLGEPAAGEANYQFFVQNSLTVIS